MPFGGTSNNSTLQYTIAVWKRKMEKEREKERNCYTILLVTDTLI